MRYFVEFGPEALHIRLEGALTFQDTRNFHMMAAAMSRSGGRKEIHLNLALLTHVDSTGARFLMEVFDIAKRLHLLLVFVSPQGQVREALEGAASCNNLRIAA